MVWDEISHCLDRFVELWESAPQSLPDCESFLERLEPEIKGIALVELIKLDMDYRRRGSFPTLQIEDYVARFPDLLSVDSIEPDLIYEEFHLRAQTHSIYYL